MKVWLQCFLDLVHGAGINEDYIDNWSDGIVIYYFGANQFAFRQSCIPYPDLQRYLNILQLGHLSAQLPSEECHCDWA